MAKINRTTESEVALATLRIAVDRPDGIATFNRLKKDLPNHLKLSDADRAQSLTRKNEEIWEQLIRNIKSHHDVAGNILCEGYAKHIPRVGYQITDSGRRYITRKGV
jgi:phosphoribosylformimino-5-aminoimidazole carboxamide ribonucleotide (ProFAR) isomerase